MGKRSSGRLQRSYFREFESSLLEEQNRGAGRADPKLGSTLRSYWLNRILGKTVSSLWLE